MENIPNARALQINNYFTATRSGASYIMNAVNYKRCACIIRVFRAQKGADGRRNRDRWRRAKARADNLN